MGKISFARSNEKQLHVAERVPLIAARGQAAASTYGIVTQARYGAMMMRSSSKAYKGMQTLENYRRVGRHLLSELGLSLTSLRGRLLSEIRYEINSAYDGVLPLVRVEGETVCEVADRWLLNSGEASRILKRERGLSFKKACIIAAAEHVEFPAGVTVALQVHKQSLRFVQRETGLRDDQGISDVALLCLHFMARSATWERSMLTADESLSEQAAEEIKNAVAQYISLPAPEPTWRHLAAMQSSHQQAWCVLEALIRHEWF